MKVEIELKEGELPRELEGMSPEELRGPLAPKLVDAVMYLRAKDDRESFWEVLPQVMWEADRLSIKGVWRSVSGENLPILISPEILESLKVSVRNYKGNLEYFPNIFPELSVSDMEYLDRAWLQGVDGKIKVRKNISAKNILGKFYKDYLEEINEREELEKFFSAEKILSAPPT